MTHQDNLHTSLSERRFIWLDRALVSFSFFAFLGVGYLLLTDFSFVQSSSSRTYETVALAIETSSNVRKRPAAVPVWNPIEEGQGIQSRDQVFTDKGSFTVIEFFDGSQVRLEENTLVTIERQEDKTSFNVLSGNMTATGGSSEASIEINIKGVRTLLEGKGSQVQVKAKGNGKSSISVLGGSATVVAGKKTMQIAQNQEGEITEEGSLSNIRQIPFVLLTPESGKILYTPMKQKRSVELSWEPIEDVGSYKVEVARNDTFKKLIHAKKTNVPLDFVELPKGRYFWRLSREISGETKHSFVRSFTIREDRPPRLASPENRVTFSYKEMLDKEEGSTGASVRFSWRSPDTESYRFQLAADKEFTQVQFDEETEQNYLVLSSLAEGSYFWRVRNVDSVRPKSPWSPYRVLTIESVPLPRFLSSLPEQDIKKELSVGSLDVRLDWNEATASRGYELQIATDSDFSSPLLEAETLTNQYVWKDAKPGAYFMRARPIDAYERKTRFSEPRALTISVKPPSLLRPATDAALNLLDLGGSVSLYWEAVPFAESYQVEVSEEPTFEDLIAEDETAETYWNWKRPKVGTVYWRVRARVGKGQVLSETRQIKFIETPMPDPPSLELEYDIEIESKIQKKERRSWWKRWFIKEAIAAKKPTKKGVTVIHWKSTGRTNQYYLELSQDKKFSKIIKKKKLKKPFFRWEPKTPGRYYLRVASIDKYNRRSEFSKVSTLLVRPYPPRAQQQRKAASFKEASVEKKMRLAWRPVRGAESYEFELKLENKTIIQKELAENYLDVNFEQSGDYSWRVRAILADEIQTRFSKSNLIKIDIIPTPPKYQVLFLWEAVTGSKSYEIEISKNPKMAEVRSWQSDEAKYETLLEAGKYYWRVAAVDGDKKRGVWSATHEMLVPQTERPTQKALAVVAPPDLEPSPDSNDRLKRMGLNAPIDSETTASAPGQSGGGGGGRDPASSSSKAEISGIDNPLEVWASYAPAISSFTQTSNNPATRFSGLSPMAFFGGARFSWGNSNWGVRASYGGLSRTLFESSGGDQNPIATFRHDAQGSVQYRFLRTKLLGETELVSELGYRYQDMMNFRTRTSTSLQLVSTQLHSALVALAAQSKISQRFGANIRLGYSYPLFRSGVTIRSALNLFAEAGAHYELFKHFYIKASYGIYFNKYNYTDTGDTLTAANVLGTINDTTHSWRVGLLYKFIL